MAKADLIIHPVRLRILQTMTAEELSTQEIADRLPEVPTSTIYRHLRLLLEGGIIEVAETRLVHGIQEKVYRLAESPRLDQEAMADLTADAHLGYFTTYVLTLLQGFADYVAAAEEQGETIDMAADYTGYTEASFFATDGELDRFSQRINEALAPLAQNRPGGGRRKHKIAIITHPVRGTTEAGGRDQEA